MSWKVHETDEVFAALRGLCSNSYRMYDPSEYRSYYDHDCDVYECAVEDAAQEYERLLRHCDHQREQLKAWGNVPTLRRMVDMDEKGITDELREFARLHTLANDAYRDRLLAIADRIDERHERKVRQAHADGLNEQIDYLERFVPSNYILLPLDDDGVPIHVGDGLEINHNGAVRTVESLGLFEHGWTVFCNSGGGFIPTHTRCRHVQPDSWERIIADALTVGWQNGNWNEVTSADIHDKLVERCRRLAGEAG